MGKLAYVINTNEIENSSVFLRKLQEVNNWQINNGELIAVEDIPDDLFEEVEPLITPGDADTEYLQVYLHVCW